MKSDSAYQAEVAELRKRLDAVEAERDELLGFKLCNEILRDKELLARTKLAAAEAIISTAHAAPDAVEAAIDAVIKLETIHFKMSPDVLAGFRLTTKRNIEASLTAANLKALKTIEDAQAAPDAVEAAHNSYREFMKHRSLTSLYDAMKNALTAAGINIAAEQNSLRSDYHDIAEAKGQVEWLDRENNRLRTNIAAERERAEKAESSAATLLAERDRLCNRLATQARNFDHHLAAAQTRAWIAGRDAAAAAVKEWGYFGIEEDVRALQPPADFTAPYDPGSTMEDIFGKDAAPVDGESKP